MSKSLAKAVFEKGYRVTELGNVLNSKGVPLSLRESPEGYYTFSVRKLNGVVTPMRVCQLAAYQKFGDSYMVDGVVARHLDDDSLNDALDNIGIGTQGQNAMDRPEIDRREHAAKGNQKHSPEFIALLKADREQGMSYKELCEKHGICKATCSYYLSNSAKRKSFTFS
jgi:hypothetical protein